MLTKLIHPSLHEGQTFARVAIALGLGRPNSKAFAEARFPDTPEVGAVFDLALAQKTSVGAGVLLGNSEWAGNLAATGIAADALAALRDRSIFETATGFMRQTPFQMVVPRQTDGGSAGFFVQEGHAIPPVSFGFDQIVFSPYKLAALSVVVNELLRAGSRVERTLRDVLMNSFARALDTEFLDPTIAADDGRPGAITSASQGATAIVSTGSTAAQITTDLGAMLAAITTSGSGLHWVMRRTTLAHVALALGASASDVPRTLLGIPLILSGNSPPQVTLADLAEIAYAAEGLDLTLAQQAAIEMVTPPTQHASAEGSPATVTATSLVSLFQTNSVAFKTSRYVNWLVTRPGAVAVMPVTY